MVKGYTPITVNELIKELESIRDVFGCGDLEVRLSGSRISNDSRVYGVSASISKEESYAYVIASDEYKEI